MRVGAAAPLGGLMSWVRLPAVEGSIACLTCGAGAKSDLDPDRPILVGFGTAGFSMDGRTIWEEAADTDWDSAPTVSRVEGLAVEDPDHDWQIWFEAPLYSARYQRQGLGVWVLVDKGLGFA